jgi:predicted protein tyrosine phosphatase
MMSSPPRPRLRVLFVCALNQWRSPTAERIYRQDSRLEVRSAGIRADANRPLIAGDIEWANVIFVMDREQKQWIQERFRDSALPRIRILDIPDSLIYMDPRLQKLLREAIDPEIDALIAESGK